MNVRDLIEELNRFDGDMPVTVLTADGLELVLGQYGADDKFDATAQVVTIEGGGAAPAFVAINTLIP